MTSQDYTTASPEKPKPLLNLDAPGRNGSHKGQSAQRSSNSKFRLTAHRVRQLGQDEQDFRPEVREMIGMKSQISCQSCKSCLFCGKKSFQFGTAGKEGGEPRANRLTCCVAWPARRPAR
jgi:hypothetical protein